MWVGKVVFESDDGPISATEPVLQRKVNRPISALTSPEDWRQHLYAFNVQSIEIL